MPVQVVVILVLFEVKVNLKVIDRSMVLALFGNSRPLVGGRFFKGHLRLLLYGRFTSLLLLWVSFLVKYLYIRWPVCILFSPVSNALSLFLSFFLVKHTFLA